SGCSGAVRLTAHVVTRSCRDREAVTVGRDVRSVEDRRRADLDETELAALDSEPLAGPGVVVRDAVGHLTRRVTCVPTARGVLDELSLRDGLGGDAVDQ